MVDENEELEEEIFFGLYFELECLEDSAPREVSLANYFRWFIGRIIKGKDNKTTIIIMDNTWKNSEKQ